jgi:hypothetical protein
MGGMKIESATVFSDECSSIFIAAPIMIVILAALFHFRLNSGWHKRRITVMIKVVLSLSDKANDTTIKGGNGNGESSVRSVYTSVSSFLCISGTSR